MDKQAEELKQVAETRRTQDGIIVTMKDKDKILFDVNKAELTPGSKESLLKIADILKKYSKTNITVAGYTDSTGSADYNRNLSEKRADAVRFFLSDNGIPPNRITARGFGKDNPIASNDTVEGRAQNRRVELHIVPNDELNNQVQQEPQGQGKP